MSHRWYCPDEYEARRRARRDADCDAHDGYRRYSTPYDDCPEASNAYRREYEREVAYREEEIAMERQRERRRAEERAMEEEAQRQAEEEAYWRAQEEAHYREMQEEHYRQMEVEAGADQESDTQHGGEDDLDEDFDQCPTCKGKGTVNPLTAPADFFCVGVADCPHCDGTGRL